MNKLSNAIASFTGNYDQFEAVGLEWLYRAIEPDKDTEKEIEELAELMEFLQEIRSLKIEEKNRVEVMAATFAIIGIGACLSKIIEAEVTGEIAE